MPRKEILSHIGLGSFCALHFSWEILQSITLVICIPDYSLVKLVYRVDDKASLHRLTVYSQKS